MIEKHQRKQYYVAFIGNLPLYLVGIHMGWSGPSIPRLLTDEFPFNITSDEASYVATSGFLGVVIGSFLILWLADLIGRKKTLITLTIPLIFSFSFIYLSYYTKILLYLARICGGVSEGGLLVICGIYVAEIAEPNIRGKLGCFVPIFCISGLLQVNILSSYLTLYNAALFYLLLSCIIVLLMILLPETPYYYLMEKQTTDAVKVLKYLLNKPNVVKEIDSLSKDVNRQMSESHTFKDLFMIKSNRKAIFIMIGAKVIQQYIGNTALGYYNHSLLENLVPSINHVLSTSLIILAQLIMTCFSSIFIDKFGRKPLSIFSCAGCFISLLILAIYFTLRDYTDTDTSGTELLPLVMTIISIITYSMGMGSVISVLLCEMFSQSIKSKAICIISIVYAVSALTSVKFYQVTSENYGNAVPFYVFALLSFSGILWFMFAVPETKNKSLEDIQQVLKGNQKDIT